MYYKKQLIEKGRKIQKQKWKKQNDGLKTKHCATWTLLKIGYEHRCSE
jgi:hypothetical protein